MENFDNEKISPVSKEIGELLIKNLLDEVRCNKEASVTFFTSPIQDEKPVAFDNYCSTESIKKEQEDDLNDVFSEDRTATCSKIKIEPEISVFDTKQFTNSANKDEKSILNPFFGDFDKFNNLSTYEEWKLKNEELYIKEEEVEQTETRISANYVKKGHQELHVQNPKEHYMRPKELGKLFKCDDQAFRKRNLKNHISRHQNPEDVKKFKCDQCNYQTFRKGNLKIHLRQHKDPEDVKKFICYQCDYQTLYKSALKTHLLRHKDPEDVKKFICDQCDYQTLYKSALKMHLLQHKNPEDVKKFKCDQCDYKAIRKSELNVHLLRHINPEDVKKFKCDQCDHQTFRKDNLKRHLLQHKNPEDVTFKCE